MGIFNNYETIYNFITAVYFFIILQSVPHIYSSYMGHQFTEIVKNSDLYRNIFLIIAIWFIVNYTARTILTEEIQHNIYEKILLSIFLFIFVLFFSRQEAVYNMVEILLLFIMYIIYQVKSDNSYDFNEDTEKILDYTTFGVMGLTILLILIGYFKYMELKKKQKGKRFTYAKFIFGKREEEYNKSSN